MSDPHDYVDFYEGPTSEYDDFYEGPTSEYDEVMESLKEALRAEVKTEITDRLAKLQLENIDLKGRVKGLDKLEREARLAKSKYDSEVAAGRREGQNEFRKTKLSELLALLDEKLYSVEQVPMQLPKCEKCDDSRRLKYVTPRGRESYDMCECAEVRYIWTGVEVSAHQVERRDGKFKVWWTSSTRRSRDADDVMSRWLTPYHLASEEQKKRLNDLSFPDLASAQAAADRHNKPIPEGATLKTDTNAW